MSKFKKGDVVYRPYKPKFVGVVREVRDDERRDIAGLTWVIQSVEVAWEDGTVDIGPDYSVKSLDELIARHESAVFTHKASRARAWKER